MSKTLNTGTTRSVSVPSVKVLAEVTAFPDEVMVVIKAQDAVLTADQARELASQILSAADESALIDWDMDTDPDNPALVQRA